MSEVQNKTAGEYSAELRKENSLVRGIGLVEVLFLIGVLAAFFMRNYTLITVFLLLAVVWHLFVYRGMKKRYFMHCENANLGLCVMPAIGAETIEERGTAITEEDLARAELVPFVPKTFSAFKSFRGSKNGAKVSSSDVVFAVHTQEKGIAAGTNSGNLVHFELPFDTGMNIRILDPGVYPESLQTNYYRSLGLLQIGNPAGLHRAFKVFAGENTEPERLGNAFSAKLNAFREFTPGFIALSIRGSAADVYIRNRFLGQNMVLRSEMTEKALLTDPFPELKKVIELIQTIDNRKMK